MVKDGSLISFKDLMKAKMDREKKIDDVTLSDSSFHSANPNKLKEDDTTDTTSYTGSISSISSISSIGSTGSTNVKKQAISPEKNFTKTPNSVVKVALAQGLFRGKSKQIYDYLWQVSRGSVNPTRKTRRTFNEIQKGAGLGSRNTVISGIAHLESIGLISREIAVGVAAGNSYEIFTPEELGFDSISNTNFSGTTDTTETTQFPVIPVVPKSGITGIIQTFENNTTYDAPNTFFKDNQEDDDDSNAAFSAMSKKFDEATRKLTGKGIKKNESEKWANLADLLILELEKAAKHTNSISSVPAFLTEILRRRFFASSETKPNLSKSAARGFGKTKPDLIGKPGEESFEIKPLDEPGREEALAQLEDFAEDDFLESFRKWYTEEDWRWLTEKLKRK